MPLYEYECTSCRTRFEVRQRMTEDPIKVCPTCGGATKRVLHAAGIIFKGSGWYITDSRQSDSAATSSTTSEKSSEKASEKSSEKASAETKKDGATSTTKTSSESTSKPTSPAGTAT